MKPVVSYLPDAKVDDAQDREIRGLLTLCFTKPQDNVFETRRYFREPYPHRWVIRGPRDTLLAHVGAHEKEIVAGARRLPIGGIAEVCVHPDARGRGYVPLMLQAVHALLTDAGCAFAVLFGDPRVYGSSGYTAAANLSHGDDPAHGTPVRALVRPLADAPWPDGPVFLPGPTF